jgi:hypothetical protein
MHGRAAPIANSQASQQAHQGDGTGSSQRCDLPPTSLLADNSDLHPEEDDLARWVVVGEGRHAGRQGGEGGQGKRKSATPSTTLAHPRYPHEPQFTPQFTPSFAPHGQQLTPHGPQFRPHEPQLTPHGPPFTPDKPQLTPQGPQCPTLSLLCCLTLSLFLLPKPYLGYLSARVSLPESSSDGTEAF